MSDVSLMKICRFYGPGPQGGDLDAATHAPLFNWVASDNLSPKLDFFFFIFFIFLFKCQDFGLECYSMVRNPPTSYPKRVPLGVQNYEKVIIIKFPGRDTSSLAAKGLNEILLNDIVMVCHTSMREIMP